MSKELAALETRLALLEDERDVVRTLHAYGHAVDYGDEAAWVDCFTNEGVFEVRDRRHHRYSYLVSGRAELEHFISTHSRRPHVWHKHLLGELVIELDGNTANCRSYFFVLQEYEERPIVRVFGRYLDSLERGADGRWRLRERVAEVESTWDEPPRFFLTPDLASKKRP
jgi:ketosteroid isomerase-like protein